MDFVNQFVWLFQVAFVTRRKNELEKRVEELIGEREQLNSTLEETSDKIVMLERHAREQDCQVMKMYLNCRMWGQGGSGFQFSFLVFNRPTFQGLCPLLLTVSLNLRALHNTGDGVHFLCCSGSNP